MPVAPSGVSPNWIQQMMMKSLYEGGGMDPTFGMAAGPAAVAEEVGAGSMRLARLGQTERAASFIDPSDPLGTTRHLLRDYVWEPTKEYLSRAARPGKTAGTATAKELAAYEANMHRVSNIGKAAAAFEDVEVALPEKAPYYRAKLKQLGTKLEKSGGGRVELPDPSRPDLEGFQGKTTPVPTDIVKELRLLLMKYEKDLSAAGIK